MNQNNLAELFARWRQNPLLFDREVIGCTTSYPWQDQALEAFGKNDRIAIRSGHGVGKTSFLARCILAFGSTREDAKIPVTAPVSDQLSINLWGELRKWHASMYTTGPLGTWLADQIEIGTDTVKWSNGNLCVARTARRDNPEALAGFHAKNLLFIIDEASGVDELIFETALGALSTPGAKQIMTGNPTRPNGYFFNAFHKNREAYYTMKVSSEDVPAARGHIEDVARTYGKDSNAYRVRVLGEFPTQTDDQLIPTDIVRDAVGREVLRLPVRQLWGVDVGYRTDRSTMAKRCGNVLSEPPKIWVGYDTMQLVGAIKKEWDSTNLQDRPSEILVDSIGIGAGVVHRLAELQLPVRGVAVSEAPFDPRFLRLRDEIWWRARDWFMARDVSMPAADCRSMEDLITELSATLLRPPTSTGKIQIESKDETKKRLGYSPDVADGFVLTFAGYPVSIDKQSAFSPTQARTDFDPLAA